MLDLAAKKAEDTSVRKGTRYDALRLISLNSWGTSKEALVRYAAADNDAALIRGAVEGLGDVPHVEAATALHQTLSDVPSELRVFVMNGLLRADGNRVYLLDAISAKMVSAESLSQEVRQGLISHANPEVRKQA
ncbi:hypothetical protein DTL42_02715 [Bremerella cremea]|uniref:HEAT repeat domain-containing protein n=1 Tax=Bremerella cremea TaxID=1031537 RepID=A0A368KUS3_9BACT|nr:hypothetical protein [Bremerella cremea]RCS54081.1 hypothetical protein DTL42_02715 [Bremerella cremea]